MYKTELINNLQCVCAATASGFSIIALNIALMNHTMFLKFIF